MAIAPSALAHHAALDARLVAAVREIRLLESVSWPARLQEEFVAAWRIGRIHLPKVEYARKDYSRRARRTRGGRRGRRCR